MPPVLPFTGERFTPECAGGIWYEHWHRYALIREWVAGKSVLDAACGEGYGSAFLAANAARVTGVDVSAEAIAHAKAKYAETANLEYVEASVTAIPLPEASVDVVVSFETIEHLAEQEAMLAEFRRVLRPEGILVLSAPNRPVYSDGKNYRNEFHVREHDHAELAALLATEFPQSHWYAQRLQFNSVLWDMSSPKGEYGSANSMSMALDSLMPAGSMPAPMYFLVVCGGKDVKLPRSVELSLFADRGSEVLQQYERLMAWQWEAKEGISRLEAEAAHARELAAVFRLQAERAKSEESAKVEALRLQFEEAVADAESAAHALRKELESLRGQFRHRDSMRGWLRWPLHRLRRFLGS
jgi:SAM-dependent methyltransferase